MNTPVDRNRTSSPHEAGNLAREDRGPSTWFITGASSGIGLALAQAAAERGDNVIAVARSVTSVSSLVRQHGSRVLALSADVREPGEIEDAVVRAIEAFGRIDIVANNAGYGLVGAVEEATDEQARAIFDTNVFGVLNVLRATLPVLRAQGAGHILQGSSYLGRVAIPGIGLLAASKYAVEGLTDALVGEVAPLGIKVTLVEPGPTVTAFTSNLDLADPIGDYDQSVRKVQKSLAEAPAEASNTPERVAAAMITIVEAERPPLRFTTGSVALGQIREALQSQLDELESWAETARAVDSAAA